MRMHRLFVSTGCILPGAKGALQAGEAIMLVTNELSSVSIDPNPLPEPDVRRERIRLPTITCHHNRACVSWGRCIAIKSVSFVGLASPWRSMYA